MKFVVCAVLFSAMFVGTICFMQPELLQFGATSGASYSSAELEATSFSSEVEEEASVKVERKTKRKKKKRKPAEDESLNDFMQSIYAADSGDKIEHGFEFTDSQKDENVDPNLPKGLIDSNKIPPPLQVTDWTNAYHHNLSMLKGKIVVIDFWATWCAPCLKSIPHNNEIWAKYRDQDVVFIGVCTSSESDKMKSVAKEKGIKYPIAIDKDSRTADTFGVTKYPTYCIIDKQGHIRIPDCRRKDVESAIKFLLDEDR